MLTRIMVFYDGNFFKQGNLYFRYKENRGWFSLSTLHSVFEKYIALKTKSPIETTKVVAAHLYNGRVTTNPMEAEQIQKERYFDMALIEAGIVAHYLPVKEKIKGDGISYTLAQKGIDVKLALDVLDAAHMDRFDVAVLIAGDTDFVPLIQAIASLGKQTLLAYFDIDEWIDHNQNRHSPTRAGRALLDAASYSLNFNNMVEDQDWETEVKSLFFMPK